MKLWMKALVCLVLAAALAFGLELVQIRTQTTEYRMVQKADGGNAALDLAAAELSGAELRDGKVAVSGKGEILLDMPAGTGAKKLKVAFRDPAAADISVQIVFSGENVPKDSQRMIVPAGMDSLFADIPEGEYTKVKLKITGEGTVAGVEAIADAVSVREKVEPRIQLWRVALLAGGLFALFMALCLLHRWTRVKECFVRGWKNVSGDWKNTLIHLAVFAIAFGAVYAALRFYMPYAVGKPFNWMMRTLALSAALAAGCLFCFRKTLAKKAEVFFLIFCLLIGGNIAVMNPTYAGNVWDEAYHYANANSLSYLGETPRMTEADSRGINNAEEFVYKLDGLDAYYAEQDGNNKEVVISDTPASSKDLWMFFGGIGLYIGRALGLSYRWTFVLGRITALLGYAVIGYFAVRRLKSGKMILASVLLIPEAVLLASSYSYDPGVTVWIALGMSYYFAEWQEREKKLTWLNAVVMIASLFLGCLAKAVYFPVMLLPFFLPKDKFCDKGTVLLSRFSKRCPKSCPQIPRWAYYLLAAASVAGMVLVLLVPFLTQVDEVVDARGRGDIDGYRQAMFILQNPLEYTGILLEYLQGYLSPDKAYWPLVYFGMHGTAPNWVLYVIIMAVAAFSDRMVCDDHIAEKKWMKPLGLFILFAALCVAASSLYVAFTEVGDHDINGMQHRYLIPLIYPAMMLLGFKGMHNESNRAVYNGVLFGAIGFVGFSAVLLRVVNLYS